MARENSVLSALGLGALFSLVKAPCVGAIYLTILNLIAVQKAELEGIVYLCMYNFGVILPILIIGTADPAHTDNQNCYRRRVKSDKGGPVQEGEESPDKTGDRNNSGCAWKCS
jgi:hypothetical protein